MAFCLHFGAHRRRNKCCRSQAKRTRLCHLYVVIGLSRVVERRQKDPSWKTGCQSLMEGMSKTGKINIARRGHHGIRNSCVCGPPWRVEGSTMSIQHCSCSKQRQRNQFITGDGRCAIDRLHQVHRADRTQSGNAARQGSCIWFKKKTATIRSVRGDRPKTLPIFTTKQLVNETSPIFVVTGSQGRSG